MKATKEKTIGLETFYDEGKKQALIYLYGKKEDAEYAFSVYERWMDQPDFDDEGEWNEKKYGFERGWTHQMVN